VGKQEELGERVPAHRLFDQPDHGVSVAMCSRGGRSQDQRRPHRTAHLHPHRASITRASVPAFPL